MIDPVLKCIAGDYTGRFIHLENCRGGEQVTKGIVVGGGAIDPETQKPIGHASIDLHLEDELMDPVHC